MYLSFDEVNTHAGYFEKCKLHALLYATETVYIFRSHYLYIFSLDDMALKL